MKNFSEIAAGIHTVLPELIGRTKREDVAAYVFIMERYRKRERKVAKDPLFRFVYQKFYGMDRFVTNEFEEEYFKKLEKGETSLENVLTVKSNGKLQYSFSTKLLHTLNPDLPIFDANVGKALGISPGRKSIEGYVKHYEKLKEIYSKLKANSGMAKEISRFQEEFKNIGSISKSKAIDFLLWQYGKLLKSKKQNMQRKI